MTVMNKRFVSLILAMCVLPQAHAEIKTAIFAGGCFWCSESDFEKMDGVIRAVSGYTGGSEQKPTYQDVSYGRTHHTEAVKVTYDSKKVSYQDLVTAFWFSIDPLVSNRQFCDTGTQYQTVIFYSNKAEKDIIEASQKNLEEQFNLRGKIKTQILSASTFWPAEKYHQDYYKKNPIRYKFYRYNCGRDERLKDLWGDKANWKP